METINNQSIHQSDDNQVNLDLVKLQLELEEKYNLFYIQEKYKSQWISCLSLLRDTDGSFNTFKEYFNITDDDTESKTLDDIIKVLYILDELGPSYYSTVLEVLLSNCDRKQFKNYWINLLNFGASKGLWKYRNISIQNNPCTIMIHPKFIGTDEYQKAKELAMYKLPMIVKPRIESSEFNSFFNRGSGYLKYTFDSIILGSFFYNEDICSETLDYLNKVKLKINHTILDRYEYMIDLDKIKDKVSFHDFEQIESNLKQYQKEIGIAKDEIKELNFYLTHKVDTRGRTYCQGYHLNYQGNSFNKACIELGNKEIVFVNEQQTIEDHFSNLIQWIDLVNYI